jgi:hypothetical protein
MDDVTLDFRLARDGEPAVEVDQRSGRTAASSATSAGSGALGVVSFPLVTGTSPLWLPIVILLD